MSRCGIIVLLVLSSLFIDGCREKRAGGASGRRVVIIAIDGMDYHLTRQLIAEGRLPNLARLADDGSFVPIQTSMPPLSPVAWSNFITGTNPGGHGVYDFLRRDPARVGPNLLPEDAVSRTVVASKSTAWPVPFTRYAWPAPARQQLLRRGNALWEVLAAQGVSCTVYKAPANYPVSSGKSEVLAGMGTPDVQGGYGSFTYLSDRESDRGRTFAGGQVLPVTVRDGEVRRTDADGPLTLRGPDNPFLRKEGPEERRHTEVPFDVCVDAAERTAVVSLQGQELLLRQGEWSEWQAVDFSLVPALKSVAGLVRFYLQEASPNFRLFVSPVNLAPGVEGIASGGLDLQLLHALGPYYTKGMSEETKAFTQGLFTTDEYLKQTDLVVNESVDALDYILGRSPSGGGGGGGGGLQFIYFSTLDLNCHVLWHLQDREHPLYDNGQPPQRAQTLVELYARMDEIVGRARAKLAPGDRLYVMSDHGFGPAYREFNLNAWLAQEGYLVYQNASADRAMKRTFAEVDWSRTRAYGIGFQSLYLNRRGREASGVVAPPECGALADEIRGRLLALRDDGAGVLHGVPVFAKVYRPDEIYTGPEVGSAPDLVLGYNRGFCPSDDSVLGNSGEAVIADHVKGFTGHHTTDFALVPGVLFCNRKWTSPPPAHGVRLEDVTATILADYGASPAPGMTGVAIH